MAEAASLARPTQRRYFRRRHRHLSVALYRFSNDKVRFLSLRVYSRTANRQTRRIDRLTGREVHRFLLEFQAAVVELAQLLELAHHVAGLVRQQLWETSNVLLIVVEPPLMRQSRSNDATEDRTQQGGKKIGSTCTPSQNCSISSVSIFCKFFLMNLEQIQYCFFYIYIFVCICCICRCSFLFLPLTRFVLCGVYTMTKNFFKNWLQSPILTI